MDTRYVPKWKWERQPDGSFRDKETGREIAPAREGPPHPGDARAMMLEIARGNGPFRREALGVMLNVHLVRDEGQLNKDEQALKEWAEAELEKIRKGDRDGN